MSEPAAARHEDPQQTTSAPVPAVPDTPLARDAVALEPQTVELDLRTLNAARAAELRALAYEHKLLVFPKQRMNEVEYIRFARTMGTPEPYFQAHYHHPDHPEIFVSSNLPTDGQKVGVAGTGRMWHADYSFFDRPLAFTCIYPQVLPGSKRETSFIDMARVWRALPARLQQRCRQLTAFQDAWDYYKVQPFDIDKAVAELIDEWHEVAPGASHPMAPVHPVTGETILYVSSGFTKRIEGVTHEESEVLKAELFAIAEQERFRHCQTWSEGDVFLWDNRTLIHHASTVPKGQTSCSYRISLYDVLPFRA